MHAWTDEVFQVLDPQLWAAHAQFGVDDFRLDFPLFSDVREDEALFFLDGAVVDSMFFF